MSSMSSVVMSPGSMSGTLHPEGRTGSGWPVAPRHVQCLWGSSLSRKWCWLFVFFDNQGLVYRQFVPQGQGINGQLYLQILQELCDAVHRHCPRVWRARNWAVLHDGAPPHRSLPVQTWFTQVHLPQMPHPPYSPDLNPPDYCLFALLKKKVHGELYPDLQQLMNTVDQEMGQIPAHEWMAAMERYVPCLHLCIAAHGAYFEHDGFVWNKPDTCRRLSEKNCTNQFICLLSTKSATFKGVVKFACIRIVSSNGIKNFISCQNVNIYLLCTLLKKHQNVSIQTFANHVWAKFNKQATYTVGFVHLTKTQIFAGLCRKTSKFHVCILLVLCWFLFPQFGQGSRHIASPKAT